VYSYILSTIGGKARNLLRKDKTGSLEDKNPQWDPGWDPRPEPQ